MEAFENAHDEDPTPITTSLRLPIYDPGHADSAAPAISWRDQTVAAAMKTRPTSHSVCRSGELERDGLVTELTEHRERMHDLLSSLPGVVFEVQCGPDLDEPRIQFVSEFIETMFGYTVEEWMTTPALWLRIAHPADRDHCLTELAAAFEAGRATLEHRWMHRDGSIVWTETHAVTMTDSLGIANGFRGVCLDITARKRAEVEMETVQQKLVSSVQQACLAEAATNALHDVGNVLNSVNLSAAIVADRARQMNASAIDQIATMLQENARDLPAFFANDRPGAQMPKFLRRLAAHFSTEQSRVLSELDSLRANVEHIHEIVATQQAPLANG